MALSTGYWDTKIKISEDKNIEEEKILKILNFTKKISILKIRLPGNPGDIRK